MSFRPQHFLRMSNWSRRPPSTKRVILVLGIVALCLVLAAVEHWVGWPDWLMPNTMPRGRL